MLLSPFLRLLEDRDDLLVRKLALLIYPLDLFSGSMSKRPPPIQEPILHSRRVLRGTVGCSSMLGVQAIPWPQDHAVPTG